MLRITDAFFLSFFFSVNWTGRWSKQGAIHKHTHTHTQQPGVSRLPNTQLNNCTEIAAHAPHCYQQRGAKRQMCAHGSQNNKGQTWRTQTQHTHTWNLKETSTQTHQPLRGGECVDVPEVNQPPGCVELCPLPALSWKTKHRRKGKGKKQLPNGVSVFKRVISAP